MNYLYRKSKFLITIILHTLRANMSYKAPANKSNTRSKQQIKELLQLDLDKLRLSILSGYPIAKVKKLNQKLQRVTGKDELQKQKLVKIGEMLETTIALDELQRAEEGLERFIIEKHGQMEIKYNSHEWDNLQLLTDKYEKYRQSKKEIKEQSNSRIQNIRVKQLRKVEVCQLEQMMINLQKQLRFNALKQ